MTRARTVGGFHFRTATLLIIFFVVPKNVVATLPDGFCFLGDNEKRFMGTIFSVFDTFSIVK